MSRRTSPHDQSPAHERRAHELHPLLAQRRGRPLPVARVGDEGPLDGDAALEGAEALDLVARDLTAYRRRARRGLQAQPRRRVAPDHRLLGDQPHSLGDGEARAEELRVRSTGQLQASEEGVELGGPNLRVGERQRDPVPSAVCAVGAVPVPVDVDVSTAGLDVEATQRAITERTAAIIPVHLYGRAVDVEPFLGLGPTVIEDAAQAQGASAGVGGRAAALSFYPTKNLGGIGDGGAVLTDDASLAADVRMRRQHGMTEQYVHEAISQNFRMSEIEAGWLRVQLAVLHEATNRRRSIARHYRAAAPWLEWQADHEDHVYHLCVAKVADRDAFRETLAAAGVGTAVHYPLAIGSQPAYRPFLREPTPIADDWAARCVSMPCFPEMTDAEVERVAEVLAASGS